MQRLQNRAARIVTKTSYYDLSVRSTDLIKKLGWQTIEQRRDFLTSSLMFKCVKGLAPNYLCDKFNPVASIHSYNTRHASNNNLFLPQYNRVIARALLP